VGPHLRDQRSWAIHLHPGRAAGHEGGEVGRIIHISSSGAQTGAPTAVPYTSSKAAMWA